MTPDCNQPIGINPETGEAWTAEDAGNAFRHILQHMAENASEISPLSAYPQDALRMCETIAVPNDPRPMYVGNNPIFG